MYMTVARRSDLPLSLARAFHCLPTMVYIVSWDEFVERSVQLFRADPHSVSSSPLRTPSIPTLTISSLRPFLLESINLGIFVKWASLRPRSRGTPRSTGVATGSWSSRSPTIARYADYLDTCCNYRLILVPIKPCELPFLGA